MNFKSRTFFFSFILLLSCALSFHFSLAQSKVKGNRKVTNVDSLESAENFLQFTCKITTKEKLLNPVNVILYSNNRIIDHQFLQEEFLDYHWN